jgi:hypothetical protein
MEDVIPLVNGNLQLRLESLPKRGYLAPQGRKLVCDYDKGYARDRS